MIAHLMLFLGLISRGRFRSLSHWSCPKMPGTYSTAKGSNCQSKFWIHFITSLTSQENFYFGHNYKTNKLVLLVQYIDIFGFFSCTVNIHLSGPVELLCWIMTATRTVSYLPFLFQSLYVLTDTNISNILIFINYGLTVIINIFSKFDF